MTTIKKVTILLYALMTIMSLSSCVYRVEGHRRWWWHHHHDFHPGPARINDDNDGNYYGLNNYLLNNVTTASANVDTTVLLSR